MVKTNEEIRLAKIEYEPKLKALKDKKQSLLNDVKLLNIDIREVSRKCYGITTEEEVNISKRYSDKNKQKQNNVAKLFYAKNKDKVKLNNRLSILAQRHHITSYEMYKTISRDDLVDLINKGTDCSYCETPLPKVSERNFEHIIPINKLLEFDFDNLIIACKGCNSSKRSKDLIEWAKEKNITIKKEIIIKYNELKKKHNL